MQRNNNYWIRVGLFLFPCQHAASILSNAEQWGVRVKFEKSIISIVVGNGVVSSLESDIDDY